MKIKKFLKDNWTLLLVLIYIVSPVDFIPESIFGPIGVTDDVTLLILELFRKYRAKKKLENISTTSFGNESEVVDGKIVE